jgi:hypothetical protein
MHPSRLRFGPSQSRPLTDASPGSARSPGLRVCRAAPLRHRSIHTHAPFRAERQSFLRCRDMRLTTVEHGVWQGWSISTSRSPKSRSFGERRARAILDPPADSQVSHVRDRVWTSLLGRPGPPAARQRRCSPAVGVGARSPALASLCQNAPKPTPSTMGECR